MLKHMQTMMREEPITFLVFVLMVLGVAFGVWEFVHVVKR
jgi:hypothetical protein